MTIIIIASIVAIAYASIAGYNYVDGKRLDRSAQACKELMDNAHAREQAIVDRQARNAQARQDADRTARVAAEKAARLERESRVYTGVTVVNMRSGARASSFADYQKNMNW